MLKALLGPFLKLSKSPEGLETFYGELKEVALYSQHRAALYKHMMY